MPSYRSRKIADAIRRTDPLAAAEYLSMADLRDEISYEAQKISRLPVKVGNAEKSDEGAVVDTGGGSLPASVLSESADGGDGGTPAKVA